MSAENFCCRLHLKRGQARLGSPLFKLKQQPKTQAYTYLAGVYYLVFSHSRSNEITNLERRFACFNNKSADNNS